MIVARPSFNRRSVKEVTHVGPLASTRHALPAVHHTAVVHASDGFYTRFLYSTTCLNEPYSFQDCSSWTNFGKFWPQVSCPMSIRSLVVSDTPQLFDIQYSTDYAF